MKVIVIGGGIGGVVACKGLRKYNRDVDIVLIEPKEYCQTVWVSCRALFDPKMSARHLSPLADFCKEHNNIKHIRTTVSELTEEKVVLANGETITDFDVCVIAVGAKTKWPELGRGPDIVGDTNTITTEGMKSHYKQTGEKLLKAKSVLIVGGGMVGCELAGEIATYSNKQVPITLVHSGEYLCYPPVSVKAAKMIQAQLESQGVKIILNEKASEGSNGEWTLKSGETIQAEHVIQTTGLVPCNDFVKVSGALDEKGFVKIDEYLRVGDNPRTSKFFAIGECCLFSAGNQIVANLDIIGHNIHTRLQSIETETEYDDVCYKALQPAMSMSLVTTGPKSGVFDASWLTTKRFLPWLKNKTMFLFNLKTIGLKEGKV